LHHTQKTLVDNEQEYRIELYVHPSYDFVMELLSVGNQVRVLEPESLRNQIVKGLKEALGNYK